MDQAISMLLLVGIVIIFSGVVYAFTNDIIGNWGDNADCTINKVNIISIGKKTLFLNYFIGFNGVDDDIMDYGLRFLDSGGDMVRFASVSDLGNQTITLLDPRDDTKIIVQHHAELQKTIAKTIANFDDNSDYLAIGTISTTANGQQIAECSKIADI